MSPEDLRFTEQAFRLGGFIQDRLGVDLAALTHPIDLVACGIVAYAGQEGKSIRLMNQNPSQTARDMVRGIDPVAFRRLAGTPGRFLSNYPRLIGGGRYEGGTIVTALKGAYQKLGPQQGEVLERDMAILLAHYFRIKPTLMPPPEVRVDPSKGEIRFNNGPTFSLPYSPDIVMEYGPGLVAYHKVTQEMRLTPQTILVENNKFVNQALITYAGLNGLQPPRIIGREDGITGTTEELLRDNGDDLLDIVIMSMVHSAGLAEIEAGIVNGRRLLRRGGLMVVQNPNKVNAGETAGVEVYTMLTDHFGANPRIRQDFSYRQLTTRQTITGFKAIFEK